MSRRTESPEETARELHRLQLDNLRQQRRGAREKQLFWIVAVVLLAALAKWQGLF